MKKKKWFFWMIPVIVIIFIAASVGNVLVSGKDKEPKAPLLEKESHKSFKFFWNEANTDQDSPGYGLIRDRAPGNPNMSSMASVGFGLTAYVIGAEREWVPKEKARKRTLGTLKTLLNSVENVHGFFYHFLNIHTGERSGKSEVSSIDTTIALNGVITAGEYFGGKVQELADQIYRRVDWQWFRDPANNQFYMAYRPESGFGPVHWNNTGEQLSMYVLAAGSPTHPVDGDMFYSFERRKAAYKDGNPFIYSWFGSLFTYQFSHAWVDFRHKVDKKGVNWWKNSVIASKSARRFAIDKAKEFKTFGPNAWGLTASDGPKGYNGKYGSDPSGNEGVNDQNFVDGTLAPSGAIGSIVFTPKASIKALKHYYKMPDLVGPYGLKDAYNLDVSPVWYDKDVIGIDKGISLLMIENYRSGLVWKYYMQSPYVQKGMKRIGFTEVHE